MSLDDVEQALFESKWEDAERDAIEVIARMLELPENVVERVMHAAEFIRKRRGFYQVKRSLDEGSSLDGQLKKAIEHAAERGIRRAWVRWAILNNAPLSVHPSRLTDDVRRICDGCPVSLECAVSNFSTPKDCHKKGPPLAVQRFPDGWRIERNDGGTARCTPLRLKNNMVQVSCEHPRGTWTIDVLDFVVR